MQKRMISVLISSILIVSTFSLPVMADGSSDGISSVSYENNAETEVDTETDFETDIYIEESAEEDPSFQSETGESQDDSSSETVATETVTVESEEDTGSDTEEMTESKSDEKERNDAESEPEEVIDSEETIEEEAPAYAGTSVPTEQEAYQRMIALKSKYPEGMRWTNANSYNWKGGIFSGGAGCAGFAFLLSDAAFGSLPARTITDFTYDDLRVGDILRIYNNTHSVIILEKYSDHLVLAEGNYGGTIHWGRNFTKEAVGYANYMITRYPEEEVLPEASITLQPQSLSAAVGQTITFSVNAENATAYQWQYSKDGKIWFSSTSTGSTTNTLSVKITSSNQNYVYRCKVTGADGNVKSSSKAGAVVITGQPENSSAPIGTTASFTVTANNISDYQWQYSKNDGEDWYKSNATGSETSKVSFKSTASNQDTIYRCKLTTTNGISAYSAEAGFEEILYIIKQPENVTVAIGSTVSFSVNAIHVAAYQWQYSKDGKTWNKSNASGNAGNAIRFTATTTNKNYLYRCMLTGTDGSVQYTDSVKFTVG